MCPWERHLTLISRRGQAVYPLWWSRLTIDYKLNHKRDVLCWSGIRRMRGGYTQKYSFFPPTTHLCALLDDVPQPHVRQQPTDA